jgi:predicted component of type VI protein secretion system
MMTHTKGGLLDRLAVRVGTMSSADLGDDVLAHVDLLLGTRAGSSLLCPAYGMPDTTVLVHHLPASLPALQRCVIDAILRSEPRLSHLTPLRPARLAQRTVCFQLRGDLIDGTPLSFLIVLESPLRGHVERLVPRATDEGERCS